MAVVRRRCDAWRCDDVDDMASGAQEGPGEGLLRRKRAYQRRSPTRASPNARVTQRARHPTRASPNACVTQRARHPTRASPNACVTQRGGHPTVPVSIPPPFSSSSILFPLGICSSTRGRSVGQSLGRASDVGMMPGELSCSLTHRGAEEGTLHYITVHYITLHYIAWDQWMAHPQYITLHYITSPWGQRRACYITLHYITLHYITLH